MLKIETIQLASGRSWQVYSGGAGPALVWLHGLRGVDPGDALLERLQRRHRVIAPLAPGFHDLDEIASIDNVHELALDYDDLLEHLKLENAALIGHSFGGMMAAELAAHVRNRARKLVLLAPVGLWNDAYPVADIFALPYVEMDKILWHDHAAREAIAARQAGGGEPKSAGEQTLALVRSLTAASKFTWPIPDKGLRRRLKRIVVPTLVIFGAEDQFVPPRYAEDFAAGLPQGKPARIAGAGHMVPQERPDEVAKLIEDFLS